MKEETVVKGFGGGAMVIAFVIGAAAGAVTALLAAPESRRKLVELARRPKTIAERIPAAVHEARAAAKEAFTGAMAETH
jgi:gas vesicle protein